MTEVLRQLSDSEVEVYWIAKRFYGFSQEISHDLLKLKELTMHLLLKQNPKLFSHVEKNDILDKLPLDKWYTSCFAGVLSKTALIRIWDKICGGSRKIVVFVLLELFNMLNFKMQQQKDLQSILDLIEGV